MALRTPRNLLTAALSVLIAGQLASAQPAARRTEVRRLEQLRNQLRADFQQDHAMAVQWANERGLPVRVNHPDGRVSALMFLRNGRPCAYVTHNVSAADSVGTDELWTGGTSGLDLDGSGVLLHEWDGSEVRLTHQEFTGGAVSWADDTNYGYSSHSTHVAGTLVAAGTDASARGMSYAATVDAYDFYDDNAEMAAAAAAGARLSNHSYGWVRGWYHNSSEDEWYWYGDPAISATEDASFGFYDSSSQAWDQIAYNAPYYLICKSAGNDRNDYHDAGHYAFSVSYGWEWSTVSRGADGGATGYDSVSQQGCAKNILTVGAVYDVAGGYAQPSDVLMSSFSGWGPTDDGRVKPDIVANGTTLYSSTATSDTSYGWYSGTSMATPSACGSLGLLVQHHRATHASADMRSATLKGLVIHTADECGTSPGPDYSFGWGQLNALHAADYITQDETAPEVIQELSLAQGETHSQSWIYDGENPVMATICWTDPAGTPVAAALDPTNLMLVNDLDLRIIDPEGATHYPWRLDPAAPAAAATRGDNFRDNVEVVLVDNPVAGVYTIEVTHKGTLVGAPQDFALILAPPTDEPGACAQDEILDCNGNCAPASWYGDGICDDGSTEYNGVAIDFSCVELNDDDGDCPAATPGAWDILWRDSIVGVAQAWLMDGDQVTEQAPVAALNPAVWTIAGLDDFNGDGQSDILWYKMTTGKTYLYLMNGTQVLSEGPVITLNPLVWSIAGVGDFNGDGKADILWRRLDTGKVIVHLMDGFTKTAQGKVATLPPNLWSIAGVGDFNRDGKSDIVWRRTDTGKTLLYLMDGFTKIGQGNIGTLNPNTWALVGIHDFDGDGRADILWQRIATGKTVLYLMDGYTKREQGNVGTLPPDTWEVAGLGDVNADGKADILWRRLNNGNTLLYFMDGYTKIGQGSAGSVDLIWDVVGLGDFDGPP